MGSSINGGQSSLILQLVLQDQITLTPLIATIFNGHVTDSFLINE